MTMSDGQVSLIMDYRALQDYPRNQLNLLSTDTLHTPVTQAPAYTWRLIEVLSTGSAGGSGLGFEESGIVAAFSEPMAHADIPCYYLSCFYADFLLVPAANIPVRHHGKMYQPQRPQERDQAQAIDVVEMLLL